MIDENGYQWEAFNLESPWGPIPAWYRTVGSSVVWRLDDTVASSRFAGPIDVPPRITLDYNPTAPDAAVTASGA